MDIKSTSKLTFATAATLLLGAAPGIAQDTGLGSWDWGAEVYFWGADLGGQTTSGKNISMPIDDILDNLKMGFMGTVGAKKGPWILFADAFYLDLGNSQKVTANVGALPVDVKGSFDLKGFSSTFGGGYQVLQNNSTTLHATAGARFLWLDADVKVDASTSIGGTPISGQVFSDKEIGRTWDAVVGMRGVTELNDKWYVTYYGDIGTGDSDFTWQAAVDVNYRLSNMDLVFGYRYLDFEFDGKGLVDNLNMSGPFAGVKFKF